MAGESKDRNLEWILLSGRSSRFFRLHHAQLADEDMFESMCEDDLAQTVIKALQTLKCSGRMPMIFKRIKCCYMFNAIMKDAATALQNKDYQLTQILYNKALCYAVNDGCCVTVYEARSKLANTLKSHRVAMLDLECSLKITNQASSIRTKANEMLALRLNEISKKFAIEDLIEKPTYSSKYKCDRLFTLESTHAQIMHASTDVAVKETYFTKTVIASRNIKVGTVVAKETAVVIQNHDAQKYLACSECCTLLPNLTSCNSCTSALYCNTDCLQKAYNDYHDIECQIMDVVSKTSIECRMAFKAVMKMKKSCNTWEMFISHSHEYGLEKLKNTKVDLAYNDGNPFSLLSFRDEKELVAGTLYNLSFDCAMIVQYLEVVPQFYPTHPWHKQLAMKAVARVMMALAVFKIPTLLSHKVKIGKSTCDHNPPKYAWFSFTSKLRNECHPNLIPITTNNAVVLVACRPIKQGTELTIPYLGHFLDNNMSRQTRKQTMFALMGKYCSCIICIGVQNDFYYVLSDIQQTTYRRLDINKLRQTLNPENLSTIYPKLCKALAFFHNLPFSKEYKEIYTLFRECHHIYQTKYHIEEVIHPVNEVEAYEKTTFYDYVEHKSFPPSQPTEELRPSPPPPDLPMLIFEVHDDEGGCAA